MQGSASNNRGKAKGRAGHPRGEHDVHDVIPLYFRIYLVLQQRIRAGEWNRDTPMPSEQELALAFKVSRVTIRKAMNLLEEAGLVLRQRGRGTFARNDEGGQGGDPSFSGLLENIRDFERDTQVRILEFKPTAAPDRIAEQLGVEKGTVCLRIVRVRSSGRSPFSYSTCWVPFPEAEALSREGLGSRTVIASLEAGGIVSAAADQRLTAVLADTEIAGQLRVPVGSPLISMRRSVTDRAGRVIELIEILYRPDRFEYRVSLSREGGQGAPPRWVQAR